VSDLEKERLIASEGGDAAFLSERMERKYERSAHVLEQVGVAAEVFACEKLPNLSDESDTCSTSAW
jgi:hypothetical protein